MQNDRETRGTATRSSWSTTSWILVAAALCSCATPVPLYEGPVRPDAEVAILEAPGNASILQVDGENIDRLDKLFALEPGTHIILFRARHTANDRSKGTIEIHTHAPQALAQCFATLEMKAGHRYVVHSSIDSQKKFSRYPGGLYFDASVDVALVDETSGTPVPDLKCAEKKP